MVDMDIGETIYENVNALEAALEAFRPDDIPEREGEMSELKSVMKPAVLGGKPRNAIVYGHSGQGKTLGVRLITEATEEECEKRDIDFTTLWINCEGADSSYSAIGELIVQLKEKQGEVGVNAPTGYQKKTLFNIAKREMEDFGGTIVVVLDEVDALGEDDYILYELSRLEAEGVKLGVIGITNDYNYKESISTKVQSSMGDWNPHFTSYDAGQLRSIIKRRCVQGLKDTGYEDPDNREGFYSERITEGAIKLCAAHAAQASGDARHAILILNLAAEAVDEDPVREVIKDDDIERAKDQIEQRLIVEGIQAEPQSYQLALLVVAKRTLAGQEWSKTSDLKEIWDKDTGMDVVHDTFHSYLTALENHQRLESDHRSEGMAGGASHYWKLAEPSELVVEALFSAGPTVSEYATRISDYHDLDIQHDDD